MAQSLVTQPRHEAPKDLESVRDGDAGLMPRGLSPNAAVPGHRIVFLWPMAVHKEIEDRQFGGVNIEPGIWQTRMRVPGSLKNDYGVWPARHPGE
jgi:5-deoxy-glucuronate isomerase